MYANQSFIVKIGILFYVILPFIFSFGLQVIFFYQFTLYYWNDYPAFDLFVSALFYVIVYGSLISLIACTCTNAGGVNKEWSNANLSHATFANEEERRSFKEAYPSIVLEKNFPKYEYCTICKLVIPPKTNHCNVCNKCTLNLDHHCPWVGNCIGFYNQKLFVLFCAYTSLSCILLSVSLVPQAYKLFTDIEEITIVLLII